MKTNTTAAKQNDKQYALEKINATLAYLTHPYRLTAERALRLIKDFAEGDAFERACTQKDHTALKTVETMVDDLLSQTRLKGAEIHDLLFQVYYA